jgi:hypothetical protein
LDHFFFCFFAPDAAGAILTIALGLVWCWSDRQKGDWLMLRSFGRRPFAIQNLDKFPPNSKPAQALRPVLV